MEFLPAIHALRGEAPVAVVPVPLPGRTPSGHAHARRLIRHRPNYVA